MLKRTFIGLISGLLVATTAIADGPQQMMPGMGQNMGPGGKGMMMPGMRKQQGPGPFAGVQFNENSKR